MFRHQILMPRRLYTPTPGTVWLPFRTMTIGVSPNLISWNPDNPSAGGTAVRATLSNVTTPTPPVSAKAEKVLCDDADGVGTSYARYTMNNFGKYAGITTSLIAQVQASSLNLIDGACIRIYDYAGASASSAIPRNDTWATAHATRKIHITTVIAYVDLMSKNVSTANTTDILYVDNPILTVPRMVSPNGSICYPEGITINGQGYYLDGVDDFIVTDPISISANMTWGGRVMKSSAGAVFVFDHRTSAAVGAQPIYIGSTGSIQFNSNGVSVESAAGVFKFDGKFHWIWAVGTQTGKKIYYDGALVASDAVSMSTFEATQIHIGTRCNFASYGSLTISDAIVSPVAMTQSEIRAIESSN